MIINRVWAMPDKRTFTIKPIAELLDRYVGDGKGWIDLFAGSSQLAEITNDINPNLPAKFHMESEEFMKRAKRVYKGALFDPPYSLEQMKRSYEDIGRKFTQRDGQIANRWTETKNLLIDRIASNGYVISFGWNSNGMGKKRGFKIVEILLVSHGAGHNDTIVTVEQRNE